MVVMLLRGLPPLEVLSLSGDIETELLDFALLKQGNSLRQLTLGPFIILGSPSGGRCRPTVITEASIQAVGERCPKLRDLTAYICRIKSDTTEAAMYQALGRIASLKRLSLFLDCANYGNGDSSFNEFEKEPFHGEDATGILNGHVRNTIQNCAMDELLARSIWTTISKRKTGALLQSLRLEPLDGTKFGPTYVYRERIVQIVSHLGWVYLLERINDYDGEGDDNMSLSDLNQASSKDLDERCRARVEDKDPLIKAMMRVFRSIWPEKEGSIDWRDDWSSLPLQRNAQ